MKTRISTKAALTAMMAASAVLVSGARAQQGGGQDAAGSAMRNSPKGRLGGLVRGLESMERDPKAALTAPQARRMVAAIRPWQSRPRMGQGEARNLYMSLNSVLTTRQKDALDRYAAQNRRFRGSGGFGGQQAGAVDMQQMRQRMQAMRGFRETMNPFYPPTSYPEMRNAPERMQDGMKRRYQAEMKLLALLQQVAHGGHR